MDSSPLVSIILLCHNQKPFVKAAIESVQQQTYSNLELIIIDDASTDGSQEEIISFTNENPDVPFMFLDKNLGNCKAFNIAFKKSQGDFIIDLAADDLLLPNRIEVGIKDFKQGDDKYGVHFSDAYLIDPSGKILSTHYQRNETGQLTEHIPSGDLYELLIKRYFICPTSMMIKREVLEELNGYNEALYYEDFDFWIRSSRNFSYLFNPAPLVKKRMVEKSLSSKQYRFRNKHQQSTFQVCETILELNQKSSEYEALVERCNYEIRHCIKTGNLGLILQYLKLRGRSNKWIMEFKG